ncbi:MAG: NADH-quinone oxidoreductase subunit N [Gemmatimonadales bacterium]|nr:NADH-quinone oxidoreductase subunit N [Gemmatimonadales bacterium]
MPVGDVLPELLLVGGGVVVLLFALFAPQRLQPRAGMLALATLGAAGVVIVLRLEDPQTATFAGTYAVDGAAAWAKLIILGSTAAVVVLSLPWFRDDPRHGEYYTILLYSALGAVVLASATDLMELVLGVLLSSATGAVLAAYHRRSKAAAEAAVKYYLLGALSNGVLLYGVVLLFGLGGTTTFDGLRTVLAAADADHWTLGVAVGLVVVGLAFKMGAVPVHAWMPDIAEGAPAPVAAFLTVVPKVGALVVLGRLAAVLPASELDWRPLISVVAALTMTLGNLAALRQDDVRRLLGWSAVSQTGYALMALVALGRSPLALPALVYFLVAYALANLAAFAVVIDLRGLTSRTAYAGLVWTRPGLALALTIAFLSFIGIPPLAGFTGKLALFGAAIDSGYLWLAAVAAANTVLSLVYYARVIAPVFFDRADVAQPVLAPGPRLVAAIGAAGALLVGVGSGLFMEAFRGLRLLPW